MTLTRLGNGARGLAGLIARHAERIERLERTAGGGSGIPTQAAGDLIAHDGTTLARLAAGVSGRVLSADSAATVGLRWRTPSDASGGTTVATVYRASHGRSSTTPVTWASAIEDTGGYWSGGQPLVAPSDGLYLVAVSALATGTSSLGSWVEASVYVDGVQVAHATERAGAQSAPLGWAVSVLDLLSLTTGQVVTLRLNSSTSSIGTFTDCHLSLARIAPL